MSDGLLPIGMFSRASSLSIKTLRAYHEGGILVPAQVDPSSGYRLYTADQLADASIISRLRALDLPLGQVREVLRARDPERTRRILADHQEFLATSGVDATGPCTGLFEPEMTEDDLEHAEAIIPIDDPLTLPLPAADMAIGELPSTWAAVLVHKGSFDSIGDTYRSLGAWAARNAAPSGGRIRERYVVGSTDTADPDAYRTEISWPIHGHT